MAKLGFKQRFLALGAVFILGYAALLFVGVRTLLHVMIEGDLYEDIVQKKDVVADVLPPPLFIVESYLLAYQIATTPGAPERAQFRAELEARERDYRSRHEHWRARLPDGTLRERLLGDAHRDAESFYRAVREEFLPAVDGRHPTGATALEILGGRLSTLFAGHRGAALGAVDLAERGVQSVEREAADAVSRGRVWTLALALAFVILVGTVGFAVSRSILGAIGRITGRLRQMALADADLSTRLAVEGGGEVAELARWLNAFLDKIAGLVRAAKRSTIQLTSTATEMAATSRQQGATVQSFGASTAQIAAALKEISATGAELGRTMGEVGDVARSSAEIAGDGRRSLGEMESAMAVLAGSSASISSKLGVIHEKAGDITGVVTTITKVADQTNLLSVNAAIEAEKAGDHGRGFLVVAREIRRLADQTAAATLDIERTVQQMQSAVAAGVMEMDKFSDQVRRSVDEVRGVGGRLGQIIERVDLLRDRFEAVREGMTSQNQGAGQINDAMGSLTESVRQTVDSLREFTSAAEDMKAAVETLKAELDTFRLES
jgi:methyl-accepting chemotaxis protein WspA